MVALTVSRAPEPRRPGRRLPGEIGEPTGTAADEEHVYERALLIVGERERVAAQLVADAAPWLGAAVELEMEEDLSAAEEVAAESIRTHRTAEGTFGASLTEPAPEPLVSPGEASLHEAEEEPRDRSPVLEVGDREPGWPSLWSTDCLPSG